MNTYKLGFVILHYEVMKETIACISSIQKRIDTSNYHIVVVDNGSPNGSGQKLVETYREVDNVTILLAGSNLGFSAGNNVGFQYAKKELHCDFICMTNNDTELMQDDFYQVIVEEYEHSNYAVMGPEIHLLDGSICKYPKQIMKLNAIEADRQRVKKLLFKNKFFIESIHFFLYKHIAKWIHWNKIKHHFREETPVDPYMINARLHGCCLVFSPIYINRFDGLEVRTHFYGEEDVLFVQLMRNGMKSVYNPKLKIFHHEAVATAEKMKKGYKKRRFTYETHLKTLDMIEELYKEDIESIKEYII